MPTVRLAPTVAALLLAAAPAGASTTEIGGVAPAGASGPACGGCSFVALSTAGDTPSYRVPSRGGVITEWSVRGGPAVSPDDRVRLRVFRPGAPDGGYVVSAQSDAQRPPAGEVGTWGSRIRVDGGESVGLRIATEGSTASSFEAGGGNAVGSWSGDPAPGADTGAPARTDGRRVNVAVRVESDADRDGLGDDTQDDDDDGDGLSDAREYVRGTDPLRADTDRDGTGDNRDVCPVLRNPEQLDSEGDGRGDACDIDDDNDGICDDAERFLRTFTIDRDTDDDGLSDSAEERLGTDGRRPDTDRDGLSDGQELGVRRPLGDPLGPARATDPRRFRRDLDPRTRTNPLRRDTDADGRADGREDRNRNGRRDPGETDPRGRGRPR